MNNMPNGNPFDDIWNIARMQDFESLNKADGYRWGLSHLVYVKKELLKLEERALARRDVGLLHDIVFSKLRATEVEEELRKKLVEANRETESFDSKF